MNGQGIRRIIHWDSVTKVGVTVLWIAFILPIPWMALSSLRSARDALSGPLIPWPSEWMWENYSLVWTRAGMGSLMLNSLLVACLVVAGQLVTSTIAGYTLARLPFWGRRLVIWGFLVTMLVPNHLTLVPSFKLLSYLGLVDTLGALVVPFVAGALGTLVMQRQFLNVPRELEEAAVLDGCTPWSLIRYVLLPAVAPGLRAVATIMILFSWNNLLWPLIMTHRPEARTLPVGLALLYDELGGQWHLLMAGSVLATIPALVLLWFLTNRFQQFGLPSIPKES